MLVKAVVDTNIWLAALLNPGFPRQVVDCILISRAGRQFDEIPERVELSELSTKASEYLVSTIEQFSKFVPELKSDANIQRWLTDVHLQGNFVKSFWQNGTDDL